MKGGREVSWESGKVCQWRRVAKWERCVVGVRWQGGKGGRIARWQFGEGGRVVNGEGGMEFKGKIVLYCSREVKCKQRLNPVI